MNPVIVIFGANGFLGRYLCRHFARNGKEVVAIARSREGWSGDGMFLEWDGKTLGPWALALEGAEAVINLAGRSVNCRYTPKNRREIEPALTILSKCAEESSGIKTPEGKAFHDQMRALEDFVGFASKMSDRISSLKYGFAVQLATKLLG